jgi:GT2 family glycosyltransferase
MPISQPPIAVLMTCHNRRETTLNCLACLSQQSVPTQVYLVDDGSLDGTSEAVQQAYPSVHIIPGDGSLFWVGGMRLAFAEALKVGHHYYMWLNDDTLLEPHAIAQLLDVHEQLKQRDQSDTIVVGCTQDAKTGQPTYGGAVRSQAWYSNKFEFVPPSTELQPCDTFFGNCILIPHPVAQSVGNIDSAFVHTLGDLDYGLRAKALGYTSWVAPGSIATCSRNSISGSWADTKLSVWQRLQKATQIKGFPIRPWTVFTKRHSGPFWLLYWFLPYIRAIIGYRNIEASPTFCADDPTSLPTNLQG